MSHFRNSIEIKREQRQRKVARLVLKGVTNVSLIAKTVGACVETVYSDIRKIRAYWRAEMAELFDAAKEEQLKKLELIEENAWREFIRSKRPVDGKKRPGDPKYLELVRKCVEDRRKMLGLDEPERVDIRAQLTATAVQVQQIIENNGDFIEFCRDRASRQYALAGSSGVGGEQRDMADGQTLEVVGRPVGANGNGKAVKPHPKTHRPRPRLDE